MHGRLLPTFLECLAALGRAADSEIHWTGTGTLYAYIPPRESARGYPYIVTNRHVLADLDVLYLRFNPALPRQRARHYACPLKDERGRPLWSGHPDLEVDVAVLPFDFDLLRDREGLGGVFLSSRDNAYRISDLKVRVAEGDPIFVLGFPLGAVGSFRNAPVVRGGWVAQVQELYSGHGRSFLVDAQAFPGNSGGPVVLASPPGPALIGLAHSYLAYQDVATSDQTGHQRIVFEENTGLTQVHPVDFIDQAIRANLSRRRKAERKRVSTR